MNKFKKLLMAGLVGVTAITGGLCLTGCNDKENNDTDSAIRQVYASAVEAGYKGTYEEWLASIKGEKGDKGDKGDKGESGKSAYEIYLGYKVNYTGSEVDWLNDMISGRLMLVVTENVGDVNGDGAVNAKDVTRLAHYLAGMDEEVNLVNADVDGSGTVDKRDYDVLARHIAGWSINIPLAHKWGDVNLDGKVDEADYNILNNEASYNNLTAYQQYLGTFGQNPTLGTTLRRDQSVVLMNYYLQGKIDNFDILWGDANGDGEVNATDLLRIGKYVAGTETEINFVAADIDLNGRVDKADEKLMSYYVSDDFKYNADGYRVTLPMTIKWGDVNEDGAVNAKDVTRLQHYLAGEAVTINRAIADVDLNGVLDERDQDVLMKHIARWSVDIPLAYEWGDVNLDGKVDEADYNILNNEESYNNLTTLQKYLGTFGYDYSREEALPLFRQYLDGDIESMAPSTSDTDKE